MINDPSMKGIEDQSLFPCKNRKKLFPKLEGVSFSIHQGKLSALLFLSAIYFRTNFSVKRLISKLNVFGLAPIARLMK